MKFNFAGAVLAIAIIATILPPGYPAYIGAYATLVAALAALLVYGWRERAMLSHPTALAIVGAVALVAASVPFVYRSGQDTLAVVFVLPMLTTVALGMLARPARFVPGPRAFALLCLLAAFLALLGGAYEHFVLGVYRPGLGNNPIHYASLAAMAGGLALVGVAEGTSPWRYLLFLGPIFGLACAAIADSRGPMLGALAMAIIGLAVLTPWLWRDQSFRIATLAGTAIAMSAVVYLAGSDNSRVASILQSGTNIFRFTGGSDDIRAALYASAVEVLRSSPVVGVGLGQIMQTAETMFPALVVGTGLENLHSDWANFAAMAGVMGLLAWLLLLAAPLLLLLDPTARGDRPIVLGAVLLVTGQFALGVSNATFGILPQTMIYAVTLGYLLCRARRLTMTAGAESSSPRPAEPPDNR